jgi:hypothetical protein
MAKVESQKEKVESQKEKRPLERVRPSETGRRWRSEIGD